MFVRFLLTHLVTSCLVAFIARFFVRHISARTGTPILGRCLAIGSVAGWGLGGFALFFVYPIDMIQSWYFMNDIYPAFAGSGMLVGWFISWFVYGVLCLLWRKRSTHKSVEDTGKSQSSW